jgi:hypothetical protein
MAKAQGSRIVTTAFGRVQHVHLVEAHSFSTRRAGCGAVRAHGEKRCARRVDVLRVPQA